MKKDRLLIPNPKGKADIINQQCASVFTKEDTTTVPDLVGQSPHNSIPKLKVTVVGVQKQLANLNPSKAAWPDKLRSRFFKERSKHRTTTIICRPLPKIKTLIMSPHNGEQQTFTPSIKKENAMTQSIIGQFH